jgi:hypothetical protein
MARLVIDIDAHFEPSYAMRAISARPTARHGVNNTPVESSFLGVNGIP